MKSVPVIDPVRPGVVGPADYFQSLQEVFDDDVIGTGETIEYGYRIAGQPVHLKFADASLASLLTPALSHLLEPNVPATGLEICIWEGNTAGSGMPAPPWSWENYMSRGEIGGYNNEAYRTWFHVASGEFSMVDLENNRAVIWIRDAGRLPMYVTAAPLRMILQGWLRQYGLHFAHAAAVGTESGGVMLAGAGGAGKSSTSLICLASGMAFVSDDYCLFTTDPKPYVHSIYCSAKLDPGMLARLPNLLPALQSWDESGDDSGEEKVLLFLQEHFSDRLVRDLPIRALLVPRVSDQRETTVHQVSALTGIRALAPSTMQQISGPDQSAWRAITSLAKQVPSYGIDIGSDLEMIPGVIADLLERIS